jgi:hypothetical protein
MNRFRRRHPLALPLYLNAALLVVVLAVLLSRDNSPRLVPVAMGQVGQQPLAPAGGAGLFLMPAQFSENIWGCYIMDVDQQNLCAYTVTGNPPKLKLVAARNFRYDRRLANYNTDRPTPAEVKELVEKAQEAVRGAGAGAGTAAGTGAPVAPTGP